MAVTKEDVDKAKADYDKADATADAADYAAADAAWDKYWELKEEYENGN